MSVLIKGMEMPKYGCDHCFLRTGNYCGRIEKDEAVVEYARKNERHPDCPLVNVPPHGRLIDADALIEDLKYDVELDAVALDSMEIVGDERRKIQDDKDFKQNCILWIENAPTIIPAEEG